MRFYSTNNRSVYFSLREAVLQGLAPDNGLYMPEHIPAFDKAFFETLPGRDFRDIAVDVARVFAGEEVPADELRRIVEHTITFDAPMVEVEPHVFALELFHGPTMAFKDFGARFMSQLLGYFARSIDKEVVILVATSGDTGSAVANGFLGVPGIRVVVLYPSGKVSEIQEKQFTTLGQNITAVEVDGTFDDCQRLVKTAFLDKSLTDAYFLTSANSINIARLIPQSFYYFYAWSRRKDVDRPVVFSVPSGNFGNLTAGLIAARMGLPVQRFVAATNVNDVVPEYLKTGELQPRPSQQTMSNAMDVGNPSNFVRMMDLYGNDLSAITREIVGYAFTDEETAAAMRDVSSRTGYVLDPHGAVGYLGLKEYLKGESGAVDGIFLETAHPAKFGESVERSIGKRIDLPPALAKFAKGVKETVRSSNEYDAFKDVLGTLGLKV